jgi:hypothetical protein
MKYYFILNPAAGNGEKGKQFLSAYEKLKTLNKYDINLYETVGVGDSTRFVAEICTKYPNEDIYIFLDLYYTNGSSSSAGDGIYYRPKTLQWFADKLEEFKNKNKRCFVFTHLFFKHKAGNNTGNGWEYAANRAKNYVLNDYDDNNINQFTFLNNLNNTYKNTIWFTGHSHYKWNSQIGDNKINICNYDSEINCESAYNVHLPSCAQPIYYTNGNNSGGSEGAIMYVFDDHIEIKSIEFKISESTDVYINKFIPYCSFNIPIVQ